MRMLKMLFLSTILISSLLLSGCAGSSVNTVKHSSAPSTESVNENVHENSSTIEPTISPETQTSITEEESQYQSSEIQPTTTSPPLSVPVFSLVDVPTYSGSPYVAINDNIPYFSDEDLTTQSFESYSEQDDLGRCGTAYVCVGLDLMPTEERGDIGSIKPSGWHTVKYNDVIDGNYLYDRCHLIGFQLTGENANENNLITGTRYLNAQGMLPFENMVADYVKETSNHVLYRATPIFEGDNLLASGVLMEAESVEDTGDGILFCVYAYNVQPNIIIDYATGESALSPEAQTQEPTPIPTPEPTVEPTPEPAVEPTVEPSVPQEDIPQGTTYILNTNTKKFHYPSCGSVKQMKEKNKSEYTGNRDDIISMGYDPCKKCNP